MKPDIELKKSEEANIVVVYTRYYRGKWLISQTPQPGYEKQYTIDKGTSRLYYDTHAEAQQAAERYNKRRAAQLKGLQRNISIITWDDLQGTEVHSPYQWFHSSPSWLYAHMEIWDDELESEELIKENLYIPWSDDNHTTKEFFDILFSTARFYMYYLGTDKKTGKPAIFIDRRFSINK